MQAGGTCLGINLSAESKSQYRSPMLYPHFTNETGIASTTQENIDFSSINIDPIKDHKKSVKSISEWVDKFLDKPIKVDLTSASVNSAPPPHWFTIDTLLMSLDEPMEFEIIPGLGVLFIERGGAIRLLPKNAVFAEVLIQLPTISTQSNGLNGLAIDPDFNKNGHLFISYMPTSDTLHQYISRFTLSEKKIDAKSEKVIFRIPVTKSNGWHGTNALEFDRHGNLYISLGDFTRQTSEVAGYAQIDERPGSSKHDAQRTSANSNIYPGKILRIHPEPDGSYTIPEGNLFAVAEDQTLPEIYIMGCRNPYRFTLDPINDLLYFGDVGPDAWEDGEKGPRGYDEINITRKAGFFGWPYSVADNKAYQDVNYSTGDIGPPFNPQKPINNSPNNSGIKELPPAQEPVLWFHKGLSEEFPYLGSGGMNIMAGPRYYRHLYSSSTALPAYYDKKLLIYDWVRNWIRWIEFDSLSHQVKRIEPFLPMENFSKIIDVKFSQDGYLYVLEYGQKGYQSNQDAGIKRIRYTPGRDAPSTLPSIRTPAMAAEEVYPPKPGLEVGRDILLKQTCLTCHRPEEKIIGPSFVQIANRFFEEAYAKDYLPKKIMEGGAGNWPGNIIMPANPGLNLEEAQAITDYILSFRNLTY